MNVIGPLIQFQQQLRIFHWQTNSYAQHQAFGKAYEALDDLVDTFIETFMGKYGRSKPTTIFQISLEPLSSIEVAFTAIDNFEEYLDSMDCADLPTELLNIRDSILGEVHHLKYLLSLN